MMVPLLLLLALAGLMQAAQTFTTRATSSGTALAFGFLLLAAYFTAKVVSRIGLPKLTGYILAGIVAGPFVLGLVSVQMTSSLKVVSGAATAIIALEAGAELNARTVRALLPTLRAISLLAVVGAMVALAAALFLMRPWLPMLDGLSTGAALAVCFVIGVAMSAQSPAVVMALLAEMRAAGPLSSVILASVVVADLVVIVCFSIASAVTAATIGGEIDLTSTALRVGWELFGSIGFGCIVGALIGRFLLSVRQSASLFALTVCVVVAEVGTRIHLDPLIVMLAAGIWLRNVSRADSRELLRGFESAQLPVFLVFFALAGSKLDIFALAGSIVPVALLVLVRASSFFVGARVACAVTASPTWSPPSSRSAAPPCGGPGRACSSPGSAGSPAPSRAAASRATSRTPRGPTPGSRP